MPVTHHDPAHHQLVWDNDTRTQTVVIGPPDPEAAGWETARDNDWACWIELSGYAFGLTADATARLAQLVRAVDGGEQTHTLPAAPPDTNLTLVVGTGLHQVVLRVGRDNSDTGCRADIPAPDCPVIASLLDQLAHQEHEA
ncbi:hypothetical protein [Nonomuraea jabiensis]|uniref:hypothetical protein n=1 Tax=Nonomuraea jabiensis TaxID=882448 RepID=UPI003D702536